MHRGITEALCSSVNASVFLCGFLPALQIRAPRLFVCPFSFTADKPIPVRYTVILTDEVNARLHAMPLPLRREIGHKLFLLEEDLAGSVKKLKGRIVTVYAVGDRKDIYR